MTGHRIETYTGETVEVEPLRQLDGGGQRLELDVVDGPRWRVDVTATGGGVTLVTAWNERDELADVGLPEWLDDVLVRLQGAA